jgi:hypothetical protein
MDRDCECNRLTESAKQLDATRSLFGVFQLRVLRLGFLQDEDVGVGVFPERKRHLLRKAHAFEQVNVTEHRHNSLANRIVRQT